MDNRFIVMETNIDDCSGEVLGYTMDLLFEAGALDVFYTPVYMKKNRPAYLMTVTCYMKNMKALSEIIFRETTTIGIRYREEKRITMDRELVTVDTSLGQVKGKMVRSGDMTYVYPEYESLIRMAQETGVPLKLLYKKVMSEGSD